MTNIWIKRSLEKTHTFEIAKNAIFRFGPAPVKIIDFDQQNKILKLNLGDVENVDIIEIALIADDLERKHCTDYYGRLRTFRRNKTTEVRMTELSEITQLAISFNNTDLILTVHYV